MEDFENLTYPLPDLSSNQLFDIRTFFNELVHHTDDIIQPVTPNSVASSNSSIESGNNMYLTFY